ncbi:hypothetical protein ADL19_13500 [Streptomyces purpurogeneiscleroticus]|nr:hypothetical protein ADL19_13500 [Streptomyces purpurogeneiscleroticus]
MRKIEVNLHDTHIGLWQADADDPTLKAEIFDGILRLLKRRGFKITADPRVAKHHRCISPSYRLAARGDMRAEIRVSGRVVELKWWSERSPSENRNGPRYGFDQRKRMPYLDGLRFELERRRILAWLSERADVVPRQARQQDFRCGRGRGELSAADYIQARYATDWHTDKQLGRPRSQDYDRKSGDGDGSLVEHGARVWFRDRKGRIGTGIAHSDGGSRWMIVTGSYSITWASSFEIYTRCPLDLRRKRNERERRKRLEGEMAKAIARMNFLRAETLRKILFGAELTYGIWAVDKEAFYCPNYAGYITDRISAGRYTWDEAAAEVERVPHELRLVLPDGRHLKAGELSMARAA